MMKTMLLLISLILIEHLISASVPPESSVVEQDLAKRLDGVSKLLRSAVKVSRLLMKPAVLPFIPHLAMRNMFKHSHYMVAYRPVLGNPDCSMALPSCRDIVWKSPDGAKRREARQSQKNTRIPKDLEEELEALDKKLGSTPITEKPSLSKDFLGQPPPRIFLRSAYRSMHRHRRRPEHMPKMKVLWDLS